jgi:hypothetical protein
LTGDVAKGGALVGCAVDGAAVTGGRAVGGGGDFGSKVITTVGMGAVVAVDPGTLVRTGVRVGEFGVRVGMTVGTTVVSVDCVGCGIWFDRMTNVPVGVTVNVRGSVVVILGEAVADG